LTGDFVRDFAPALTWLVQFYKAGGFAIGLIAGFFCFVAIARNLEKEESWELYLVPFGLGVLIGPVVHFGVPWLVRDHIGPVSIAWYFLLIWVVGGAVGVVLGFRYFRHWEPKIAKWREKVTRRTEVERDRKTDVRTVREQLPATPELYDIMEHYEPGFITVGLDKNDEPVRVPFDVWRSNHIQLAGTTGAGKGVEAQMALSQSVPEGEAVFVFDPKNDEWLPHVLYQVAKNEGVPFHFIDLRDGQGPQINPLIGVNRADLKELLIAAFALSDKGTEADHYRLGDRRFASAVAELLAAQEAPSFRASMADIMSLPGADKAAGFVGKFEEMAELDSINAATAGVDFSEVIEKGGVVYLVGSMRHEVVKRAMRLLMVRLVQICEQRDRLKPQRSVCAFLDELKYHLSKPAMEIFGAARDKGLHALVAHQSLADLRDVPSDLDADAVVGSVIENTGLKLIYKLQDPDTAEWLARRSGTKLVDEELRKVGRNVAQSEIIDDERTLRQGETYLVDTNMLQNLPKQVAVFFSEELPQFVGTSPVPTEKCSEAITPAVVSSPATPVPVIEDEPEASEPVSEPEPAEQGDELAEQLNAAAQSSDAELMQSLKGNGDTPPKPKSASNPFDLEFDDE